MGRTIRQNAARSALGQNAFAKATEGTKTRRIDRAYKIRAAENEQALTPLEITQFFALGVSLGKGEADSSILSGSTSYSI
jgi:hypothetical protein